MASSFWDDLPDDEKENTWNSILLMSLQSQNTDTQGRFIGDSYLGYPELTLQDKSTVTANYVDENNTSIADPVISQGYPGDNYYTNAKVIDGYKLVDIPDNDTGTFSTEDQVVTYKYQKDSVSELNGYVIVNYVDTDGKPIAGSKLLQGQFGTDYTTEQLTIKEYTFKEVQGNSTGTFSNQAQTVTYIYTKNPVVAADVTAKYVDTDGNSISKDVVFSGNIGDKYTTIQKNIDGYTFKEVQGNPTGTFSDKAQIVTYVYTKDLVTPTTGGDITVKYLDTEGHTISSDIIKKGPIGSEYSTDKLPIIGYTFKEIKGKPFGTFTVQKQTVSYIYKKDPVKYNSTPNKVTPNSSNQRAGQLSIADSHSINKQYPTTGEQKHLGWFTSGILIVLGICCYYWWFDRRKKKSKQ